MQIVIVYLKWSYGIEVLAEQLASQLRRVSGVSIISAKRPHPDRRVEAAWRPNYVKSAFVLVNPLANLRLFRKILSFDAQVIYFISPHVLNVPLLLLCRWFTHAVIISHIHDPEYAGSFAVATAANLVARLQSRWSHRVYCWGNAIKDTIARKFGVPLDRIAVFRHGPGHRTPADNPYAAKGTRLPEYFSMIGTIIPRKGVAYYLQAAHLFNQRHGTRAVKFLLAGSGDLSRYRSEITRLPNLTVLNRFLDDSEVNEWLARSYASVLPYTGGVMQSSFIAIAYGNGCPVIVSNLGSLPEEVECGKTGYVVEKANSEQLANAMTRIYSNPKEAHMRENCIGAYQEKFSWDTIAEEMYRDMETAVSFCKKFTFDTHEISEDQ